MSDSAERKNSMDDWVDHVSSFVENKPEQSFSIENDNNGTHVKKNKNDLPEENSKENFPDEVPYPGGSSTQEDADKEEKNLSEDDATTNFPEDSYALLHCSPFSSAFVLGFLVFGLQFITYFLVIEETFSDGTDLNPLGIPVGVKSRLRVVQFFCILIVFLVCPSLAGSLHSIAIGYDKETLLRTHGIPYWRWFLSNLLRFVESVTLLSSIMTYIIASDDLVELLKDVTALVFISEIDEGTFWLCQHGFFGQNLKDSTEFLCAISFKEENGICHPFVEESVERAIPRHTERNPLRNMFRQLIYFSFLLAMVLFWLLSCVFPQTNFELLEPELFVQWDDQSLPELAYFSGFYVRQGKSETRDERVSYFERRYSEDNDAKTPAIFRFCDDLDSWVLTLKSDKECENYIAISKDQYSGVLLYDLLEVPQEDWSVKLKDKRVIPVELFMASDGEFKTEKFEEKCSIIETDEQFDPFEHNGKTWSTNFQAVQENNTLLEVYERPFYFSKETENSTSFDVILFTGLRWALATSDSFECVIKQGREATRDEVIHYLTKKFHPYWSKSEFTFLSESVKTNSENDAATPISKQWYTAKAAQKKSDCGKESAVYQKANAVTERNTQIVCSLCNADTNPCYYNGTCRNEKCECIHGSKGTLCQILDFGNGFCDPYFNKAQYAFDKGDCCMETCNSAKYTCGKDMTGLVDVGFKNCLQITKSDKWDVTSNKIEISSSSVSETNSLSILPNGLTIATIDLARSIATVIDRDGSTWKSREASIALIGEQNNMDSWIDMISPANAMNNQQVKTPVTVAIIFKGVLHVFDWKGVDSEWFPVTPSIDSRACNKANLAQNGRTLAVLCDSKVYVFERPGYLETYELLYNHSSVNSIDFVLSKNGKELVTANVGENSLLYFKLNEDQTTFEEKSTIQVKKTILGLQKGLFDLSFGVIIEYDIKNAEIILFTKNKENPDDWSEWEQYIRGVSLRTNMRGIFDMIEIENEVVVNQVKKKEVFVYKVNQNTNEWEFSGPFFGNTVAVAANNPILAVGKLSQDIKATSGSITLYEKNTYQEDGENINIRVSITLDDSPTETIWQLVSYTSDSSSVLLHGGPYENYPYTTITQETQIEKNDCVVFSIFDTGGNGLVSNRGGYGIVINGALKFIGSKFGFEDHKSISESNCTGFKLLKPWVETPLNHHCEKTPCEWSTLGKDIDGIASGDNSGGKVILSDSGDILAVATMNIEGFSEKSGNVRIFGYNQLLNEWEQMGENINSPVGEKIRDICITSDGKTVAIAELKQDTTMIFEGRVRVLEYDEVNDIWNETNAHFPGDSMYYFSGYSVSLSSDGAVLASSEASMETNDGSVSVRTRIFEKNEDSKQWIQRGQTLFDSLNNDLGTSLELSSNGTTVALGGKNIVRIMVFDKGGNRWTQVGQNITSDMNDADVCISLSSDGTTIAIGFQSTNKRYVRVYTYDNESKVWKQRGQNLPNQFRVTTSADGMIIGTSNLDGKGRVHIFHFVNSLNTWKDIGDSLEGLENLDKFGYSLSLSENGGKIAISGPGHDGSYGFDSGHVSVYAFKSNETVVDQDDENLECKNDNVLFSLNLTLDFFPEDLSWELATSDGQRIVGESYDESKRMTNITKRRCINKDQVVLFSIEDKYGDGICCGWGQGGFKLSWNDQVEISKTSEFQSKESFCLPRSSNAKFYFIDVELDSKPSETWWNLYDGSNNLLSQNSPYQEGNKSVRTSLCLTSYECIIFVIMDDGWNGIGNGQDKYLTLTLEGKEPTTVLSNFESHQVVRECQVVCTETEKLLQIFMRTDKKPYDMSWTVVDETGNKLLQSPDNMKSLDHYYSEKCVSANECLKFTIEDASKDGFYPEMGYYDIIFGGERIKRVVGNFGESDTAMFGTCSDCADGFALFKFLIGLDENPEDNGWKLVDDCGTMIFESNTNLQLEPNTYHYFQTCLPLRKCFTFNITDSQGNGFQSEFDHPLSLGVFELWWDDNLLKRITGDFGASNVTNFGFCNATRPIKDRVCLQGEKLVEISIKTDSNPSDISWSLVDGSAQTLLQSGCSVKQPLTEYLYHTCAKADECLNFTIEDSSHNGFHPELGYYDILFGGERIKKVTGNFGTSSSTLFGTCQDCVNQTSLFQLLISFDDHPEDINWEVYDKNDTNSTLWSSANMTVGKMNNTHQYFERCIPNDRCVVFNVTDSSPDANHFDVLFDGGNIKTVSGNFGTSSSTLFGTCQDCDGQSSLLQLTVGFDDHPEDLNWEVRVNNTNSTLWRTENMTVGWIGENMTVHKMNNTHQYFEQCIPNDSCLVFNLTDSSPDVNNYDIAFGGKRIKKVTGNFGTSSSTLFGTCQDCDEQSSLLQLVIRFDDDPEDILWEVYEKNNTNSTLWNSVNLTVGKMNNTHQYFEKCIPNDKCMVFNLTDSNSSSIPEAEKRLELWWNSTEIQTITGSIGSSNTTEFGMC